MRSHIWIKEVFVCYQIGNSFALMRKKNQTRLVRESKVYMKNEKWLSRSKDLAR